MSDNVCSWFKGTTFPAAPANTYVALLTTAPTARDGTGAVEVSGGSYARQAVASSGWSVISTSGSGATSLEQISNSGAVTFPTATGNWGTIVGAALYDASSAGNLLAYGDLTASVTVNSGTTFSMSIGNVINAQ